MRSWASRFLVGLDAVGRMLFPPGCVVCGQWLVGRRHVCDVCGRAIDLLRSRPACPTCGASEAIYLSHDGRCSVCRDLKLYFDGTIRVGPYVDELRILLRRFKFEYQEYLDVWLGDWLSRSFWAGPWSGQVEAIISVPTHWLKYWTRSCYVPRILAEQLARRVGLPHIPLMQRIRLDPHQYGLRFSDRMQNVREAFRVEPGVQLKGARVCVVDDVMTSGATLNEVARMLKQAGADRVWNLVLVRAGERNSFYV